MSYRHLRALMKTLAPPVSHTLQDCQLVVDGRSFFKDSYINSGCKSLLGGEYDRYAEYLRNILKPFIESNVTCYVVFNGCMDADIEERKKIHQNIIDRIDAVKKGDDDVYCEPIFVKDVIKEILNELGITYFVTENDSWSALLSLSSFYSCPILTKNYEYSLLYRSCISPKSLVFHGEEKKITCEMFLCSNSSRNFGVKHTLLPLLYTLLDEKSIFFKKLINIVDALKPKNIIRKVLRWTRWQAYKLEETLSYIKENLTEDEWVQFEKVYDKNVKLCKTLRVRSAINYFQRPNVPNKIDIHDVHSFQRAIGSGIVPVPYINLIKNQTFSGSWVVYDKDEEDAMLAAMDIVFYVKRFLTSEKVSTITFIGRQGNNSEAWEVKKSWENRTQVTIFNSFSTYLEETFSGLELLDLLPTECPILVMALLYFCQKKSDNNLIYCVLLSYVMLGPVSDIVGLIKRSYFMNRDGASADNENKRADQSELKIEECLTVVEGLMDMFYLKKSKKLDRKFLNTFAEFQHCLQHMNYMIKLCAKGVPTTVYHKAINATFIYNMYMKLKNKSCPKEYLKKILKNSTVFEYFEKIVNDFEVCSGSLGLDFEERLQHLNIDAQQ